MIIIEVALCKYCIYHPIVSLIYLTIVAFCAHVCCCSLEGVAQNVEQQDKDIKELDTRVATTDKKVDHLKKDVKMNTKDIKKVQTDVTKQGQKLDQLKEVVDVTVDKVEDLDHKVREALITGERGR